MERVDFTTMSGTDIKIKKSLLSKEFVEQVAAKHFKQEVICTPCMFGAGTVAAGWRVESKKTAEVIGYLTLATGTFNKSTDFEYGVTIDVPFGKQWAYVLNFKIRYIDGIMEIRKM